jgi:hypothetical protein
VTGGGKSVQEENGRLLGIAYLPIENLESINSNGFEGDFVYIHGGDGSLRW